MAKVVRDTGFSSSATDDGSVNKNGSNLASDSAGTANSPGDLGQQSSPQPDDHRSYLTVTSDPAETAEKKSAESDSLQEDSEEAPPDKVHTLENTSDDGEQPDGPLDSSDQNLKNNIKKDPEGKDAKPEDGVVTGRMNGDMPEGEDGWKAYYEHPLTAATTAMLNINGGESNEEQTSGIGLLYEYYKLPPLDKDTTNVSNKTTSITTQANAEEIWSSTSAITAPTITTTATGSINQKTVEVRVPIDSAKLVDVLEQSNSQQQQCPTSVVLNGQNMNMFLMNQAGAKEGESPRSIIVNCKVSPSGLQDQNAQNMNSLVSSESPAVSLPNGDMNGHHQNSAIVSIIKQEPIDESVVSPETVICEQSSILAAELKGVKIAKSPVMENAIAQHTPGTPGTPATPGTPILVEAVPVALSPTEIVPHSPQPPSYQSQVFATLQQAQVYEPVTVSGAQYGVLPGLSTVVAVQQPSQVTQVYGTQATSNAQASPTVYSLTTTEYYRDYYGTEPGGSVNTQTSQASDQYQAVRQQLYQTTNGHDGALVERYIRQGGNTYKNGIGSGTTTMGLTVDLPSPDSGIGETAITPRDNTGLPQVTQMFDYTDLPGQAQSMLASPETTGISRQGNRRSWHEYGRGSDNDKVHIPKIYSDVGFKYNLESPISTSQRREDDRITYINKGQFYGITLEYIPDPDKPLCSQTVKSMVMLVFREEKSHEDEIKAWQFWHSRQHSVKQRILDADTKNSSGIIGCIDEVTHNAITFYWNPLDGPVKVNIAVQCLSTDFSNQKGVKGLPLHLQIDTFEDLRDSTTPVHRGYCQIKVFCDKGAERKTRDEERRAAKRKLTATGRKKMDEMYHAVCERSEFYTMSDIAKPPVLFSPSEDIEKITGMELNFYNQSSQSSDDLSLNTRVTNDAKDTSDLNPPETSVFTPPSPKRQKIVPPSNERVMLYVRQENEETFNALHLVPPNLYGLCNAFENKYNIRTENIKSIFKRSRKGITVRMDDDIIKHYSNEDTFMLEIVQVNDSYDITLIEL